ELEYISGPTVTLTGNHGVQRTHPIFGKRTSLLKSRTANREPLMPKRTYVLSSVLILLALLGIAPAVLAQFTPDVFVVDQPVIDNTVNVTRLTSSGPGWVVIHADADGAPGPVIGYTAVPGGI